MTTIREFALAVREVIDNGWTQGAYARDASGSETAYTADNACRFCLVGAFLRVARDVNPGGAFADGLNKCFWRDLNLHLSAPVARWNDQPSRTQADVLDMLDEMIATRYPAAA